MNMCYFCEEFRPTNNGICESCMVHYKNVRSHINDYPDSTIMAISNLTGISVKKIMRFVNRGHFILVESNS
jgi:hypothetical protein